MRARRSAVCSKVIGLYSFAVCSEIRLGDQDSGIGGEVLPDVLELCAEAICDLNYVEEDAIGGQICGGIRVRSEYGGAGRTTRFGRLLWCAVPRTYGVLVDLYAGAGDTIVLLSDALHRRKGGLIVSFESQEASAKRVVTRLHSIGVLVRTFSFSDVSHGTLDTSSAFGAGGASAESHLRAVLDWELPQGSVGVVLLITSTSSLIDSSKHPRETVLGAVCRLLPLVGLALFDPDIAVSQQEVAADWLDLERCAPTALAIYNTNLPGGAGWVQDRLLHMGTYGVLATGTNDGGGREQNFWLRSRGWVMLGRTAKAATSARSATQEYPGQLSTYGATMRGARGGHILKFHSSVPGQEGVLIPVEMQRPTSALLEPPGPTTNSHLCYADSEEDHMDSFMGHGNTKLGFKPRVPCYLACEGPDFHPAWKHFQEALVRVAKAGWPLDEELFKLACSLLEPVVNDDQQIIVGRSRFMARQRHEFTHDSHMKGFCMNGIVSALFVRSRGILEFYPPSFVSGDKIISSSGVAINDLETALTIISDSDSNSLIEFSFLENSPWPVRLEDIILNIDSQRSSPGSGFRLLSQLLPQFASSELRQPHGLPETFKPFRWQKAADASPAVIRICGVGDHFPATFDTMLMVEEGIRLSGYPVVRFERTLLGRFCPYHRGQRHQCKQRCQLMGSESCLVEGNGANDEDDNDLISQWLSGIIHPVTLEELPFLLSERFERLREITASDPRLVKADIVACSHPSLLCVLLAGACSTPVFLHASSTLLYGLPCDECDGRNSTLRVFSGEVVDSYLSHVRELVLSPKKQVAFVAEGRFLAAQVRHQLGVKVSWIPPLAFHAKGLQWQGEGKRNALVLRSRFFTTLMGEMMRSLLREIASINQMLGDIVFLGNDNQFDEQWLSLEQMASYGAVILYPNDLHQRTFHEVYRIGTPLFIPDMYGLYRMQRVSNWGYASYGVTPRTYSIQMATTYGNRVPCAAVYHPTDFFVEMDVASAAPVQAEPWWNSFSASPEGSPMYYQRMADWEQFPHVVRFSNLPSLLIQLRSVDLARVSMQMREFHEGMEKAALRAVAASVHDLLWK